MTDFLEESNILNDNQFGFRRNHSTSHAIICLVENVAEALDQGKIVVGLMIDLKKAFDGICYKTLLKKLYAYGIRGKLFNWFKSYLTNRTQYVQYGNSKLKQKQLPMVSHKAPFWDHCYLFYMSMIFPEPRIYYFLFYLPMILLC